MTNDHGGRGAVSGWVWVAIGAAVVVVIIAAVVLFTGDDGTDEAASTTTTAPTTTTTEETTTTTEATTTSSTEAPTTTVPPSVTVPATPVVGVLTPYNDGGAGLFPPESVEAHWYQWEGFYVVLYRGFDASAADPICAGNSIRVGENQWDFISNSPYLGTADEICVGAPRIAEPPAGVFACDTLLYSVTEIPVETEGLGLFGTLEIGTADGFGGQTSEALIDIAATPEFLPDQAAYELPPSDVDPGGLVTCGS